MLHLHLCKYCLSYLVYHIYKMLSMCYTKDSWKWLILQEVSMDKKFKVTAAPKQFPFRKTSLSVWADTELRATAIFIKMIGCNPEYVKFTVEEEK